MIRDKLDPQNINHYQNVQGFIDDCKLLFANAKLFYEVKNCVFKYFDVILITKLIAGGKS
jgi:hypothetical protein